MQRLLRNPEKTQGDVTRQTTRHVVVGEIDADVMLLGEFICKSP